MKEKIISLMQWLFIYFVLSFIVWWILKGMPAPSPMLPLVAEPFCEWAESFD